VDGSLKTGRETDLWNTICHWTRRSGEKNDVACTGSCNRSAGPAGRPTEDRQIEDVSTENSIRGSEDDASVQRCW
jgi:hypothetical protein